MIADNIENKDSSLVAALEEAQEHNQGAESINGSIDGSAVNAVVVVDVVDVVAAVDMVANSFLTPELITGQTEIASFAKTVARDDDDLKYRVSMIDKDENGTVSALENLVEIKRKSCAYNYGYEIWKYLNSDTCNIMISEPEKEDPTPDNIFGAEYSEKIPHQNESNIFGAEYSEKIPHQNKHHSSQGDNPTSLRSIAKMLGVSDKTVAAKLKVYTESSKTQMLIDNPNESGMVADDDIVMDMEDTAIGEDIESSSLVKEESKVEESTPVVKYSSDDNRMLEQYRDACAGKPSVSQTFQKIPEYRDDENGNTPILDKAAIYDEALTFHNRDNITVKELADYLEKSVVVAKHLNTDVYHVGATDIDMYIDVDDVDDGDVDDVDDGDVDDGDRRIEQGFNEWYATEYSDKYDDSIYNDGKPIQLKESDILDITDRNTPIWFKNRNKLIAVAEDNQDQELLILLEDIDFMFITAKRENISINNKKILVDSASKLDSISDDEYSSLRAEYDESKINTLNTEGK